MRLIRCTRRATSASIPFLVGVSDTGMQRVIEQTKRAFDLGADYVVAFPSCFYPISNQETIQRFYRTIAEATDARIIIYNNPVFTKIYISSKTFVSLSRDSRIAGSRVS